MRSQENKDSSSHRQRNAKYFFGTLISRTTYLFEHISTKYIIDNVINHLTGFLNKCVLAFKRDNHLDTSSSVKQKTQRPSALVFSVSRMTSFSVIIPLKRITSFIQYVRVSPVGERVVHK